MKIRNAEPEGPVVEVEGELKFTPNEGNFQLIVSTGCTILDLDISGLRTECGGVPSGILAEIYGPNSIGKTAVLSEIGGSIQTRGGEVKFLDPEGRLDKEYARIYGMVLPKSNYSMPITVKEVFTEIKKFNPPNREIANGIMTDSLAALTTDLELETGDAMGMKRAKEFSAGLRKTCVGIRENNYIIACSNQIRQGQFGEVTPGGMGISFYASLRIKLHPTKGGRLIKKANIKEDAPYEIQGEFEKDRGNKVGYVITKNSLDEPWRKGFFYLMHNYGIDDIRTCLQYNKEVTNHSKYVCCHNDKEYVGLDHATKFVEDNGSEETVRNRTIMLWRQVQKVLQDPRKPKVRR